VRRRTSLTSRGDTLIVPIAADEHRLRLLCLDTEESNPGSDKPVTPWGREAKREAERFFPVASAVTLEFPGTEPLEEALVRHRDNFGRLLVVPQGRGPDVRDDGAQVVAPPSPGREFANDRPIAWISASVFPGYADGVSVGPRAGTGDAAALVDAGRANRRSRAASGSGPVSATAASRAWPGGAGVGFRSRSGWDLIGRLSNQAIARRIDRLWRRLEEQDLLHPAATVTVPSRPVPGRLRRKPRARPVHRRERYPDRCEPGRTAAYSTRAGLTEARALPAPRPVLLRRAPVIRPWVGHARRSHPSG
jgi:hypothetical protein